MQRLLGSTFDYFGEEVLPDLARKSVENLHRVLEAAHRRLGGRANERGDVPPRVAKAVLEAAFFAEDQIMAEYLGGVLASSRGGNVRDDRGVGYLAQINRLSAYDLRLHYILYSCFQRLIVGRPIDLGDAAHLEAHDVFIPAGALAAAMEYGLEEDGPALTDHSMVRLNAENLVGYFASGDPRYLQESGIGEPGVLFAPSLAGLQLFVWAHGITDADALLDRESIGNPIVSAPTGARFAKPKPPGDSGPPP